MTAPHLDKARAQRRRHLQQRQTVIFGSIIAAMLLTILISWLMLIGVAPSPFARSFTADEHAQVSSETACPPEGALTVPFPQITARVYNSTNVGGLAGNVGGTLSAAGVVVSATGNWEEYYDGVGFLVAGPSGLEEAFTLQLALPGMVVLMDNRTDAVVDVVIGGTFTATGDLSLVIPDQPIPVPAECQADGGQSPANTQAPAATPAPPAG